MQCRACYCAQLFAMHINRIAVSIQHLAMRLSASAVRAAASADIAMRNNSPRAIQRLPGLRLRMRSFERRLHAEQNNGAAYSVGSYFREEIMGRGILLWMLGVPIPIILLLALCSHH